MRRVDSHARWHLAPDEQFRNSSGHVHTEHAFNGSMIRMMRLIAAVVCAWGIVCGAGGVAAAQEGGLTGRVTDSLSARIAGADVTLLRDGTQVAAGKSNAEGV